VPKGKPRSTDAGAASSGLSFQPHHDTQWLSRPANLSSVAIEQFERSLDFSAGGADDEVSRLELAQRYAYVYPDPPLVRVLCELGPLVEIGAGTGCWARKLRDIGADVLAFDQAPPNGDRPNRYHSHTPTWTEVEPGDHTMLTAYSDRALFLCWPPLFSSLGDCLDFYEGNTVACIGDGGHRTARLRNLNSLFEVVAVHPARAVDPLLGHPATLSIWRRLAAD
jgi:hypothetical protein